MAVASLVIGFFSSLYMFLLFAVNATLPRLLSLLYPAGITLLVAAGLGLGVVALTRGFHRQTSAASVILGSLGVFMSFSALLVLGISGG